MRRAITEWGVYLSGGLFLATAAMLIASYHPDWPRALMRVAKYQERNLAYLQIRDGRACVFSDPSFESDGSAGPWIVDPRTMGPANKVLDNGSLTLPGVVLHHCRFNFGQTVWSLSISLAIPGAFFLVLFVFFLRRLRLERREVRKPAIAPARA